MDDRLTMFVGHDTDLEGLSVLPRSDEHRELGVVGCESSPVMSIRVQHVFVSDTVLAGACLDVHRWWILVASTFVDAFF